MRVQRVHAWCSQGSSTRDTQSVRSKQSVSSSMASDFAHGISPRVQPGSAAASTLCAKLCTPAMKDMCMCIAHFVTVYAFAGANVRLCPAACDCMKLRRS
jgi:hypothetical protein